MATDVSNLRQRVVVRKSILSCTRCELSQKARPTPFHGPSPTTITICAEAPGATEEREGRPLIGPAGSLLHKLLQDVGIDMDTCLLLNVVSCRSEGPPSGTQVEACRVHKLDQLALAQPKFILVVGQVSLHSFRPDLRIAWVHGRPGYWSSELDTSLGQRAWRHPMYLFPVYHPAAALRQARYRQLLEEDLGKFKGFIDSDDRMGWFKGECVVCEGEVDWYDEMGYSWCGKHAQRQLRLELGWTVGVRH